MTRPGPAARVSAAGPGLIGVCARPLALYAASHFACNSHQVCFAVSRKCWNANDVVSKLERVIGELHAELVGMRSGVLGGPVMLRSGDAALRCLSVRSIGVIAGLCVLSAQLVFWGLRAGGVKGCGGITPVK